MSRLIVSFVLTLAIFAGAAVAACAVEKSAAKVAEGLVRVERAEPDALAGEYESLKTAWDRAEKLFYVWFPHAEADALHENIVLIGYYLGAGDTLRMRAECREAGERVENIRNSEKISLENLF
ncbi:MAG: DUF4363 family protein [Clostridia bacterium]|nr:DUF4363 family protein [Clostridia bacterium]